MKKKQMQSPDFKNISEFEVLVGNAFSYQPLRESLRLPILPSGAEADHSLVRTVGFFNRAAAVFDRGIKALMLLAGLGLAGIMFAQVIMRYALDSSISGIEELAVLFGVWVYFIGMGYATRMREHIHGGVVTLIFSDPFKIKLVQFFGSITCVISACVFGYFSIKYAWFIIDSGRVSISLQWPRGLWSGSMIFGFFLMIVYFVLESVCHFKELRDLSGHHSLSGKSHV